MANQSDKPEETKPFDYFREVRAAQKQDKPDVASVANILRTDMVPTSDARPAAEYIVKRDTLKTIVGILLGLVIVAFFLFMIIGPGRSTLEDALASLAHQTSSPTPRLSPTRLPPTETSLPPTTTQLPSSTPSPRPTFRSTMRPTQTPVVAAFVSPTRRPPSPSPTTLGCRDVLSITLADVGQILCVQGIVTNIVESPSAFILAFSNKPGSFYWASYDMVWSKAEVNHCYQITGKIERLANNPIMLFNYDNIPEACP
jgi:hypothetical protein